MSFFVFQSEIVTFRRNISPYSHKLTWNIYIRTVAFLVHNGASRFFEWLDSPMAPLYRRDYARASKNKIEKWEITRRG